MAAAVAAIVVSVGVVYVFSIFPYLLSPNSKSSEPASPGLEVLIPATAIPLILVLAFLVPSRRTVDEIDETGNVKVVTRPQSTEQLAERRYRNRSILAGSIAGLAAAGILAGLIFIGDYIMGLPTGGFYMIIALAMIGITQQSTAISLGLALHLLSGTAIGGIFGFLAAVIGPFNIDSIRKGAGVGVLAGFVSFSILFIPITRFQVEPALNGILLQSGIISPSDSAIAIQNRITDLMSSVLAFSILFHVMYGAIMGALTAVLIDRLPKRKPRYSASEPSVTHHNDVTGAA